MANFRYSHLYSSSSYTPTNLNDGEIALYVADGDEKIIFKNSSGQLTYIGVKDIQNAINALDSTKSGESTHVSVEVVQEDGLIKSVTVTEDDIAPLSDLTAEITARKAVDGQNGQTYAANASATYISGATSLNDADVKLDATLKALADKVDNVTGIPGDTYTKHATANYISGATSLDAADVALDTALKALENKVDAIDVSGDIQTAISELDASKTGTSIDGHVTVNVVEEDGVITEVNVTTNDIASASALTAETSARKAVTGIQGDAYVKHADANYISAATSLDDADVKLDNALKDLNDDLSELTSGFTSLTEVVESLDEDKFGHVVYDSTAKTITFYASDASSAMTKVLGTINTTDFVKDGMIESVVITGGTGDNDEKDVLLITWNDDSGKNPTTTEIPLDEIFDADNYYTRTEVDTEIANVKKIAITGGSASYVSNDLKLTLVNGEETNNQVVIDMKAKNVGNGILVVNTVGANEQIILSAGTF